MDIYIYMYTLGKMFGSPQLHFSTLSGEVSDLNLSKNVKVMFMCKTSLLIQLSLVYLLAP